MNKPTISRTLHRQQRTAQLQALKYILESDAFEGGWPALAKKPLQDLAISLAREIGGHDAPPPMVNDAYKSHAQWMIDMETIMNKINSNEQASRLAQSAQGKRKTTTEGLRSKKLSGPLAAQYA